VVSADCGWPSSMWDLMKSRPLLYAEYACLLPSGIQDIGLAKPLWTTALSNSDWARVFCIVVWPTCTILVTM
jgi:hypothetical protein